MFSRKLIINERKVFIIYFFEVKEEKPAKRKVIIPSRRIKTNAPAIIKDIKLNRSGSPRTLFIKSITVIILKYSLYDSSEYGKQKR